MLDEFKEERAPREVESPGERTHEGTDDDGPVETGPYVTFPGEGT